MNKLYTILGILAIACGELAAGYSYDKILVKKPDIVELKKIIVPRPEFEVSMQQVNEQTLQNRIDFYQRIIWELEDRHKTTDCMKMPPADREKYRRAQKQLKKAMDDLQKRMKGK